MRRRFTLLIILLMIASVSCTDRRYYQVSGYAQGGTYSVKYRGASARPEKVQALTDSLLREIDFTLSGYNKNSLLSRLNRGDTVVLSPMFAEIYRLSYEMWLLSGGAFDVSCGPLFDIWGFGFTSGSMPSDSDIARVLASCGMSRLVTPDVVDSLVAAGVSITSLDLLVTPLQPQGTVERSSLSPQGTVGSTSLNPQGTVERTPQPPCVSDVPSSIILNFNAIAQGYSCDLVYGMLRGLGVTDMLVDIGEIRCCGLNPLGKGWSIGIDNPVDGNDKPGEDIRKVWTSDGGDRGVVTSGNYRKFYVRDGRKYSHTIDPRTGRPVEHNLLSATVIVPGDVAWNSSGVSYTQSSPRESSGVSNPQNSSRGSSGVSNTQSSSGESSDVSNPQNSSRESSGVSYTQNSSRGSSGVSYTQSFPGESLFAAAEADALATVFMVIGFDASRDFLAAHPDLEAYLITSDSIWSSR